MTKRFPEVPGLCFLFRGLLLVVLLGLTLPSHAQEAEGPPPPVEAGAASAAGPNYAAWGETAARAEALSEAGRGSAFALGRLRQEIVDWRSGFAQAQAANAARIATVEAQIAALGPTPAEGELPEDPVVAERRAALQAELARLRAPGLLAQEAYAHADGLIAEIDALTRSRTAAALLSRSTPPLDPRLWPEMVDAVNSRVVGLWKEVTTSVRSQARHETLARNWPLVAMLLILAGILLLQGRRWLALLAERPARPRAWGRMRAQAWANVTALLLSIAQTLTVLTGLFVLAWAVGATGLFGSRATALINAVPVAGACILATGWLARQFFTSSRVSQPPFDFTSGVRETASHPLRQAGWLLAAVLVARAFLAVADIAPEVRSGLLLPFHVLLSVVVFRFGRCLAQARPPAEAGPEDDLIAFRRRLLTIFGQAIMAVAAVAPVLSVVGFHRAGSALLLPSLITVGLLGLLVVLQSLVTDLHTLVTRREEGLRDALFPVLAGLILFLLALPVLALIWGARAEDLLEMWQRFLAGFTIGETRLSPRQFAFFGIVFALGWLITRLVQGTLRTTVLPRTRLDPGAQNALVSGLGYIGIIISSLLAVSIAGLDLSNLAIVAGALSVGIGFGLQNIVQNFVSGIILLIERPISEGDWIEVGGRMGYVRDISVRSTRIETFDRTDVIVPNGDLVSGQVVNWTRGNLVGRIVLPVSVAYGNDVDHVTALLKKVAEAHPMVLLSPPPAVVLAGFGADVLNFEIRAIIRDVNFGVQTRSEINQDIARRFLEESIRTAAPPPPPPPPAAAKP